MPIIRMPATNNNSTFASMKGHHVAVRVPNFEAAVDWYTEKLDFRVVHQWPYADQTLAYLAPPADDNFCIELLAGGSPTPTPKASYSDLGDSLSLAGYHHFCLNVTDIDATLTELRSRGVSILSEPLDLPIIGRRLAFITDPFSNIIELSQVTA